MTRKNNFQVVTSIINKQLKKNKPKQTIKIKTNKPKPKHNKTKRNKTKRKIKQTKTKSPRFYLLHRYLLTSA